LWVASVLGNGHTFNDAYQQALAEWNSSNKVRFAKEDPLSQDSDKAAGDNAYSAASEHFTSFSAYILSREDNDPAEGLLCHNLNVPDELNQIFLNHTRSLSDREKGNILYII